LDRTSSSLIFFFLCRSEAFAFVPASPVPLLDGGCGAAGLLTVLLGEPAAEPEPGTEDVAGDGAGALGSAVLLSTRAEFLLSSNGVPDAEEDVERRGEETSAVVLPFPEPCGWKIGVSSSSSSTGFVYYQKSKGNEQLTEING
jgi:hypothetical protein